jgi:hypothetical protein
MKVKLLKDHLENKCCDEIELDEDRGNYFIACGVAEKVEHKPKQEKVEFKPKKEKKG